MALLIHRAERSDALATALAELLADPLDDVFVEEVVAVPARGVERWLEQQLSHRLGRRDGRADGICAGVRFPSPVALINEIINGPDRRVDPWAPDALVWPLLEVIDECAGEDWCQTLGRHLGVGGVPDEQQYRRGRRYAVGRRLAGLFDAMPPTGRPCWPIGPSIVTPTDSAQRCRSIWPGRPNSGDGCRELIDVPDPVVRRGRRR